MKRIATPLLLLMAALAVGLVSCIEDGYTTSASDQPVFSVDVLDMGVIFTEQPSTTRRFTVHNKASKILSISQISISGENAPLFRLNVDGFSGKTFNNVEIRPNDSIFVLVETTLPSNGKDIPVEVTASVDFLTNGVTSSVTLSATGRDVNRLHAAVLDTDTRFTTGKPYQIYDSLVVRPGVTLTIDPGAELYFHDKATMVVRGTLKATGGIDNEITFAGDRTGNVAADISFDLMDRQWTGLFFTSTSRDNELSYCHVRNTWQGVTVDGTEADAHDVTLKMVNTRLRNSGNLALEVYHADISAYGCEFAEAANGVVLLDGGSHTFNHCTLANYYLFSALGGPILQLWHLGEDIDTDTDTDTPDKPMLHATFDNCIIYGNGADLSHGDLTGTDVYLRRCVLKSNGTDDDNFISCLWDTDPLYRTERSEYIFDYRLKEDSPARGAADPALTAPESATDRYGNPRTAPTEIGAYTYTPAE